MLKILNSCIWVAGLAVAGLFGAQATADTIHFQHSFDAVDNDTTTPAIQALTNGAGGAELPDSTTGLLAYTGSQAGGFNTTAPLDLSAESEFTVEFVVSSGYDGAEVSNFNGTFFGVTSSDTSNEVDGTALYNNAGGLFGPSIGLQIGSARGAPDGDYVFDFVEGNGFFEEAGDPIEDDTDGYSIFVTYSDTGTAGETGVTILSTGLEDDFDFSTVEIDYDYDELAAEVTPNVSSQGGTVDVESIRVFTVGGGLPGDFNSDGILDATDIDLLSNQVELGTNDGAFDLDDDGAVNQSDRTVMVKDLQNTWFGDSNLDGEFNSGDFVTVFTAGEYEDAVNGNSTWATGDWNGDGDFNSGDFVVAFSDGGFEKGPRGAVRVVPEPSSLALLGIILLTTTCRSRNLSGRQA